MGLNLLHFVSEPFCLWSAENRGVDKGSSMGKGGGATPHTVMLAVHCKRGENVDLKAPLKSFIQANYSPHDASECVDDLDAVQTMRNSIIGQT
eukprot:scaffold505310_cov39-Prasinocladus_malaysianus.AAC.1